MLPGMHRINWHPPPPSLRCLQIALGLLMLFFGGNFPVLIAAIEAFRITGWCA